MTGDTRKTYRSAAWIERRCLSRGAQAGSALAETLVSMLALTPFLLGLPLLSKQLDIKHKAYDATRYSVWEKTVWRSEGSSNRKPDADIVLEARDRALGDPRSGMLDAIALRSAGITENAYWRDRAGQRLIDYDRNRAALDMEFQERRAPVEVGYVFVPALAHGDGALGAAASVLQVDDLDLNRRAYASSSLVLGVRPVLISRAEVRRSLGHSNSTGAASAPSPLLQRAAGAVLSDTWSAGDEAEFRRRVDAVTTNELVATLEAPARPIGMQALGRGRPLYGEGQFSWDPDLRPDSATLPSAYVTDRARP